MGLGGLLCLDILVEAHAIHGTGADGQVPRRYQDPAPRRSAMAPEHGPAPGPARDDLGRNPAQRPWQRVQHAPSEGSAWRPWYTDARRRRQ
ncbi:hypothetical protein [Myxococcus sp. CA005]|uniref:hypothetical protein n=1 Tax=Myxococcus TaxID=32 RepID=UPI0002F222E6|nr:hypothetical protein [Myxococcus sp. CA005]